MGQLRLFAIRGATTVERDDALLVREATVELLREILQRNGLAREEVVSAIFTVTPDLRSEFPARGARDLGWNDVPLICCAEIDAESGLGRCIRVLLHVQADRARTEVRHVYLRAAAQLRPDIT